MKKNIKLVILLELLFSAATSVIAQRPYTEPIEGQTTTSYNTRIGDCKIASITFKYFLSTVTGEPAIYANLKWENAYGSDPDCLGNESFDIYIHVVALYNDYWIPAQGAMGLIPAGNNRWGMNPLPGSPNWDELLMKSKPSRNIEPDFLSADYAKTAWKSGYFRVSGILLLDKDGNEYHF
jgi:hypothetical protein